MTNTQQYIIIYNGVPTGLQSQRRQEDYSDILEQRRLM